MSSTSASDLPRLSFDDVSKLFSSPLSEAADTLGVCRTVLKKICHDNGLVRWPYRKFLSGKSIDEIKKDAAREKNKELAELLKATGERNDSLASSAISSSLGSQVQNRTTTSLPEISKSRGVTQQQGNKNVQNARPQDLHISNLTHGTPATRDEFKYGFPSYGLSTASNKWWGSISPHSDEDIHVNGGEEIKDVEQKIKDSVDGSSLELVDAEKSESGTYESNIGPQGTGLLSSVRKRAVEEGREALKLGVYRGYGVNKLGTREKLLLLGIFKSSLPSQWKHGSF